MPTVLISTTSLWNCGDDFIRDGVLSLLKLREDVNVVWWNRGFGITSSFANDLDINLENIDYFIVAGTPQWVMLNEPIFEHCIRNRVPIGIIGVGTNGMIGERHRRLMQEVAQSGLCEVALARDHAALDALKSSGFANAKWMIDPAFFKPPGTALGDLNLLGWRDFDIPTHDPRYWRTNPLRWARMQQRRIFSFRSYRSMVRRYDRFMVNTFALLPNPKAVIVHDNREVRRAIELFGKESVRYYSDYNGIYEQYTRAIRYVGSRLHGAIPAISNGAAVQLIYLDGRWSAFTSACEKLSEDIAEIRESVSVALLASGNLPQLRIDNPIGRAKVQSAIKLQYESVRISLAAAPILSRYLS